MIVGVPKESYPGERRVALVPVAIPNLVKASLEVIVEAGAGEQAGYPDAAYVEKGAKIVANRAAVFSAADVVVQVLCYGSNDVTGQADLPLMRRWLRDLKNQPGPVLLHVLTRKGHGVPQASADPVTYHTPPVFEKVGPERTILSLKRGASRAYTTP